MSHIYRTPKAIDIKGSIDKITSDSGQVQPDANDNVNIIGGTSIVTEKSPDDNTLTINYVGGTALYWNHVTDNIQMSANNGYIPDKAGVIELKLPQANAPVGSIIQVTQNIGSLIYSDVWKITQSSGQSVISGADSTTVGSSGYIEAQPFESNGYPSISKTSITLICIEANKKWLIVSIGMGEVSLN